jgi:hypothetical protein
MGRSGDEVVFRVEDQLLHDAYQSPRLTARHHGLVQFIQDLDELPVLPVHLVHAQFECWIPFYECHKRHLPSSPY